MHHFPSDHLTYLLTGRGRAPYITSLDMICVISPVALPHPAQYLGKVACPNALGSIRRPSIISWLSAQISRAWRYCVAHKQRLGSLNCWFHFLFCRILDSPSAQMQTAAGAGAAQ